MGLSSMGRSYNLPFLAGFELLFCVCFLLGLAAKCPSKASSSQKDDGAPNDYTQMFTI